MALFFLILAGGQVSAASCSSAPSGLIGWWPGDGNANTIVGTNNGLLQGTATASAAGVVGSAFSFDGTNSTVQIADSAVLHPTNLTIEAWVRFTGLDSAASGGSPAGDQYIVFKQNSRSSDFEGFDLSKTRVGTSDVFRFEVTSASGQFAEIHSATAISTGVWYHVAAVRGSNFTQIYVNGQLERQTNVAFAQDYGTPPLFFGTSGQTFWDHKFRGILDEVSLYNRALSSNEIAAIYAATNSGKCKAVNIISQPQAQEVLAGSNATFTVVVTGVAPLTYQWRVGSANLAGATNSALALTNVQSSNSGNYTVVISNVLGSVTSSVATLVVDAAPVITTQPQSSTNIFNTTAIFSVVANGTPAPAYQWQFNNSPIADATTSALTIVNVQPSDGGEYTVVITNSVGAITSAIATLTVWIPPSISTQPQNLTNIVNTTANFSVTASGTPVPVYQWQFNDSPIPGATTSALAIPGVQTNNGGNYTVVISNAANSITSAVAALTIWVPPSITTQPQSLTNVINTSANFSVVASGIPAPTYQWQFNNSPIAGATASALAISSVQTNNGGNYTVVIGNSANSITSAVATLTVWIPPLITTQPQSLTNVINTSANFSVLASGIPAVTYQWQFNNSPIAGATTSALAIPSVQINNGGNYTVVISNAANSITSAVATLTVWVPPSITTQPQSLTNIVNTTASFSVTANGTPPPAYQWHFNGSPIPSATTSALTIPSIQTNNGGNYTIVISNAANSITSAVATLTVWVPPSITTQPQSLTNVINTSANFSVLASGIPAPAYQWQFNNSPVAGATTSALAMPSVQTNNGGNYSVVISNSANSITSVVATLTVWVPPSITAQPQSLTNVINTSANFSVTATGIPALTYQWQYNDSPIAGATGSALSIPSVQTNNGGNYTVVISNAANSITSAVATLTVWVPPSITTQPQSLTNVINTTANFSVLASGIPAPAYQWQFNNSPIAGATTSVFAIPSVQTNNGGNYTVVISNAANSITSVVATLTVWVPPSISSQPQSLTNVINTSANFSVTATGIPALTYQWQFNNSPIASASASALTIPSVQTNDSGNYTMVISNAANSITSAVATLTVWVPPFLTTQPQSQTLVLGTNFSLTASATGTVPLAYQWRMYGTNLGGATTTSLSFTNIQYSNAGTYTVAITNAGGSATSAPAVLTVIEPDTVAFCDPNLEDAVRLHLGKATGAVNRLEVRNLTVLRALDSHITSLCGLEWATNLTMLQLGGNLISDLTVLTNLPQLTNVFLYHNLATNLTPLAKLTNLTSLDLRWNPAISDFTTLSSLTNLSTLYLGGNSISNLAFLPALTRLSFLGFDNNGISNAASLALMTNLAGLDLGYNPNLNVQSLSGLTNLSSLYLSGNSITNLSFLQNLSRLTNLCLYGNLFTDISPILNLGNLRSLNLGGNPAVTNFASLSSLTNLETLWLNNDSLSTLSFVQPLSHLTYLAANANSLTSAVSLSGLFSMTTLGLENNLLVDTASLASLTNLTILGLGGNSITNPVLPNRIASLSLYSNQVATLGSLGGLSNLTSLNLAANPLTNFSALASLTNLTDLSLFAVGVSNLSLLQPLTRLTTLDLRGNRISDVSALQGLSNLSSLNLASNLIAGAASLANLINLTSLDVSSNSLANWSFLNSLSNLTSLSVKGSSLSDLSFAAPLSRLNLLDATLNRVTNSSALSGLTNLHYFLGGYNRLRDLSNLDNLPRLWRADLRTNLLDLTDAGEVSTVQTLSNRLVTINVLPQNQPPVISIANYWPVGANTTSAPLFFGLSDDVTPPEQMTLTAVSSNPALLPNPNISFGLTSSNRYMLFTPSPNQTGSSLVTVTATDDTGLVTNAFVQLTVITQQNVSVPDANLNAIIRSLINKPTGSLNNVDLLKFNQLAGDNASISNLTGLEYATNLTSLTLGTNFISTVSPLQNLTRLSFLSLDNNLISDFSPLAGVTNLNSLLLRGDAITNLAFLSSLTRLSTISLSRNLIRDISPLSTLINLSSLSLDQNIVSNITVLPSLPALSFVDLTYNVLNTSAGSASMTIVSNLLARPVIVLYQPQRSAPGLVGPGKWLIAPGVLSRVSVNVIDSVPLSSYTLTATSTNSSLIPNGNLQFSLESGIGWTLSATPAPNQSGTTTLSLNVKDTAGLTGSTPLAVTVVTQSLGAQFFNNPVLSLSSWGDAFWFAETAITHSGVMAAQSGHVTDNSSSWLGTTLVGPGRLTYWSRVSSEPNYDFLNFYLNGVLQTNRLTGEVNWSRFVFNIPPGTNALAWGYQKDPDTSVGTDAGWLDEMNFASGVWLEILSPPVAGQTQLLLHGIPGRLYEVQFSTNFVNWSRVTLITNASTSTFVTDTNSVSGTRFYRMRDAQ